MNGGGSTRPVGDPGDTGGVDDTVRMLADPSVWEEPPADLPDRVVADIARARLADVDVDSGAADADQPTPPVVRRLPRRLPQVAAGAAVAAAAVLVLLLVLPRSGPQFELEGTELARDATAVAVIESTPSGDAISLRVAGLDPAPDGFFYQAWLRGDRGLVSIGTFHMRGGDGDVELWSGVDVGDYPTLSVTLEPEDGDERSSGEVVLAGPVADPR